MPTWLNRSTGRIKGQRRYQLYTNAEGQKCGTGGKHQTKPIRLPCLMVFPPNLRKEPGRTIIFEPTTWVTIAAEPRREGQKTSWYWGKAPFLYPLRAPNRSKYSVSYGPEYAYKATVRSGPQTSTPRRRRGRLLLAIRPLLIRQHRPGLRSSPKLF